MEKTITKKLFAGVLAISAGCLLASCDPIEAVPANYNEPLITTTTGAAIDFEDNILGTIYDSIESDTKTKVIEQILKSITDKQFGTYADFKNDTLSEKDYFKNASATKIAHFKATVQERISEFFYNEVSSGSYNNEMGQFSEEKMYNAHRQELYDMGKLADGFENKYFVTASFDKKTDFYPHGETCNLKCDYSDYIEKKVYPQILKDILVEDYIYRNNPIALGRSYGVKASYIKVSYDDDSHISVRRLMKNYSSSHIETGTADFEIISEAIKGFKDFSDAGVSLIGSDAATLLDNTYGASDTIAVTENAVYQGIDLLSTTQSFHKSTKIGELIESYNKAIKAEKAGRFPIAEDKTELDKFTGEGKSKEYGLMQKLIALSKEDYTNEGWFVKSSGAGELPSSITDRLFNIRVSQDIDKTELPETSYLRIVNGKKFVIAKDADKVENNAYNYVYDDGASAFWIATVEQAVSPAKFNSKSATYITDETKRETIGRAVAEVLATKSNYVKETYTEYLNQYKDYIFYDSALYDYFKSEYPDLDIFDDED